MEEQEPEASGSSATDHDDNTELAYTDTHLQCPICMEVYIMATSLNYQLRAHLLPGLQYEVEEADQALPHLQDEDQADDFLHRPGSVLHQDVWNDGPEEEGVCQEEEGESFECDKEEEVKVN